MASSNQQLVICIRNDEYVASLEVRKIYEVLLDEDAAKHGQLRVIDESGEDYLYPSELFVPLDLPKETEQAVIEAA
ncbi:MAG: hypothetical protein JJ957_20055 [Pseudomonadales bacterium]|nr:hypothetical protein [Pseudomonadales bacterium]